LTKPAARPFVAADAMIVASFAVIGIVLAWCWNAHDPWAIEAALGLHPTMAREKERVIAARESFDELRRKHPSLEVELAIWTSTIAASLPLFLTPVSAGVGLATFRLPRALGPWPLRRPGILASLLAGTLAPALLLNEFLIRGPFGGVLGPSQRPITRFWMQLGETIGFAILAAWLIPAIAGGWRPARDVWDRLGRMLGILWIAYIANRLFIAPLFYP
jgi:hypothetical protein